MNTMVWWGVLLIEFILIFITSQYVVKALGFVFYRVVRSTKIVISLLALIFFPGVVIHEFSHMITAGVLFVPIHNIEFLPEIRGESVKLGSVQVGESDFVRRFLIGVAPFIIGNIVMIILIIFLGNGFSMEKLISLQDVWKYLLLIYAVFVISNTMFSSKKDLEGAIEFILVAIVITVAAFLINNNIFVIIGEYLSQPHILSLLQPICLLLLFPLIINLLLMGMFHVLLKR